jgi:hypothetical protein
MRRADIILGAGAAGLAAAASLKSVPAVAQLNIGVFLKNQVSIVGDDTSGRSYSDGTYATSCNGYYSDGKYWGATGSGKYWIKPGATAFAVYCEMTTSGGGWTLIAKISGSDAVDRWGYNQAIYSDSTTLGDATTLAVADAKSTAYSSLAAQDILIRRLDGTAYVVHRYSATPVSWGQFLANNWSQCSYPISTAATTLVDDGRDSLIGSALYLHQADGYILDCTSQERAMLSQFSTHAGWNENGVGNLPSAPGVAYADAISYPAGSAPLNADATGMLEDYAFLVR